jgi:hypothetical protein
MSAQTETKRDGREHQHFYAEEGLNGPNPAWGVRGIEGSTLYEAMFQEDTAERLAELCDDMPEGDWKAHKKVLEAEGYNLTDPALLPPTNLRPRAPR